MSPSKSIFSAGKNFNAQLGEQTLDVVETILELDQAGIIDRIWKKDFNVWASNPSEIINRLGWLRSPQMMMDNLSEIGNFVDKIKRKRYKKVLLFGMGGSSLAVEVMAKIFGTVKGYLDLQVIDSTDPDFILKHEKNLKYSQTLFIVSTKSGGTVETISFMKYFYNRAKKELSEKNVGDHFVAITDPGSDLEKTANELKFLQIFLNDPDIGGRYSALSYFGLVPAALMGINIAKLLEKGAIVASVSKEAVLLETGKNTPVWLGAILGKLAENGLDKLTMLFSSSLQPFGAWIEQLIAESTGKMGKGILPVQGEELSDDIIKSEDRVFVYYQLANEKDSALLFNKIEKSTKPFVRIILKDLYDLGGEFFRWEIATAVAGHILKINPFDQPDVESAKIQARQMMDKYKKTGQLPDLNKTVKKDGFKITGSDISGFIVDEIREYIKHVQSKSGTTGKSRISYYALQAYVMPSAENDKELMILRNWLQSVTKKVVTVGYGPRFLHSTGQLHKGDGGNGLFIQLLSTESNDCPIPDKPGKSGASITFGILKRAQALGDRQALINAKRPVITVELGRNISKGLKAFRKIFQ